MGVFLLSVFGILSVQFWGGVVHRRCRVTAQPLHFTAELSKCPWQGCFDNSTYFDAEGAVVEPSVWVNTSNTTPPTVDWNASGAVLDSSRLFAAFCAPDAECLRKFKRGGPPHPVWPMDDE